MTKRIFSLCLAFMIILSLCACEGSFGKLNLQETIQIPEDGIVEANIVQQIKKENAIAVFAGESDGIRYEWTIFGSDIDEPKNINLSAVISAMPDGSIRLNLLQEEAFGFSGLLSIHLTEKWEQDCATAYRNGKAVATVSVTGSKATILNLTLDGTMKALEIWADPILQESGTEPATEPASDGETQPTEGQDSYLSQIQNGDTQVYTDGKDKYMTDPIPEGKPKPVEPENQEVDKGKTCTCTFSIECSTILNNLEMLDPEKLEMVPSNGVILATTSVTFYEGESVFDVLQRLCKEKGIHMESSWTPIYNSAYIEGIHNLYEFDCGELSGWMYKVNGWYPNYGCSRYQLRDGDVVEWRYTCDLGNDVGRGMG